MNPEYPVYIISKGRWKSRLTSKALENIAMPYHIVVEPQEYDEYANETVSNVTAPFINNVTGFGVWVDNEAIYTRDLPLRKSLVSSKKVITGVSKGEATSTTRKNPPTLFGPVVVEVRIWQ